MSRTSFSLFSLVASASLLLSCSGGRSADPAPGTAGIVIAVATVPSDVSCLEITVTGAATTTQSFDVTPNQAATITVQGLPSGPASIAEQAFGLPCAQVTPTTLATWASTAPSMVTLIPGQVVDVTITLRRAGQVQITTDFNDGTEAFAVAPSPIAFGSVAVGNGPTILVTVTNTSGAAEAPPSFSLAGIDAAQFSLPTSGFSGGQPPCAGRTSLAAGAGCTALVGFAPTTGGNKTASLVLTGSGGSVDATVAITGTGTVATFSASPNPIAFGSIGVGNRATIVVAVTNTSALASAPPVLTLTGTDAAQFSIQTSSSAGGNPPCAALTSLTAGATCATIIQFSPTTGGAKAASLIMTASDGAASPTVPITGTGGVATFSVLPSPIAFGSVGVGSAATIVAAVTNTSAFAGAPPALTLTGTDAAQFSIQTPSLTSNPPCAALTSLAAGATCATIIQFSPTTGGAKAAILNVIGSGGSVGTTVSITGTGGVATFSVSPSPIAFGSVVVGGGASVVAAVTNTSAFAGAPPTLTLTGTDAAQFSIQTPSLTSNPPCAALASLAAGASCATIVQFSPTTGGAKAAILNVIRSGGSIDTTVSITGTGGVATFSASPNPVAFGNVGVGSAVTIVTTVTNTSAFAGAPPALTLTGTDAAQFSIQTPSLTSNPPCAALTSLAAGAACATNVRFAPTSAGTKVATLNLGAGGPAVSVTGNGLAPATSLSVSPNPVNFGGVGVGGSSTVIVTVTNTGASVAAPPSFAISGTNATQFAIQTPTNTGNPPCASLSSLNAASACTTQIRFTPSSTGAKTATLNVGAGVVTVSLSGSGA